MGHQAVDHIGITVEDIDAVTDFFVGLGLEVEGRAFLEGEFLETVCGIPDSRTEIVMLKTPGDDLQAAVDWATGEGYGLVGGIGEYESAWKMAYIRGPEGLVVSLSERVG